FKDDYKYLCDILLKVDDELLPRRPAEAHFAVMAGEHIPAKYRDDAKLRKALDTRIRAEQAALGLPTTNKPLPPPVTPYSEQLLPWVRADVETADKARRKREDLLFASPKEVDRLGKSLPDADKLYAAVQERADEVRKALQLRDRVLADLPYYSRLLM